MDKVFSSKFLRWFLIIVTFTIAFIVFINLPVDAKIAVHWDVNGNPDQWMNKLFGLLLIPILQIFLETIISSLPDNYLQPGNLRMQGSAQKKMLLPLLLLLVAAEVLIAMKALNYVVDPVAYISIGIGLLFLIIGNNLKSISFGFFIGIREPLDLQHKEFELSTRSLIRWVFTLSGILIIIISFALSGPWKKFGLIFFSAVMPFFVMVYTFLKSRKINDNFRRK